MGSTLFSSRVLASLALVITTAAVIHAQQPQPNPQFKPSWQESHDRLEKSTDPAHKKLLSRWKAATAPQSWTAAEGNKRSRARFVDYDKSSDSVVLGIVESVDGKKSERIQSVPFSKLSKASQTRVAQIQKVLAELDEAAKTLPPTENAVAAAQPGVVPALSPRGTPFLPGGPVPDPSGRPPLQPGQQYCDTPWLPDKAAWRTDYNEFRKQLSSRKLPNGETTLEFGDVTPLKDLWESQKRLVAAEELSKRGEMTELIRRKVYEEENQKIDRIPMGDVVWEANITDLGTHDEKGNPHPFTRDNPKSLELSRAKFPGFIDVYQWLDVPPLPEPFQIKFEKDGGATRSSIKWGEDNYIHSGSWKNGRRKYPHRIRFYGTFYKADHFRPTDLPTIVLLVRFPKDQPND